MRAWLLLIVGFTCAGPLAHALDNGVGLRPPLGWSSWNHFHANINAEILKETADAMVANGLKDMGFEYLNLDDGWAVNRTAAGVLVADPKLFPPSSPGANDGIKIVADYVHERGLKFGIYTARGSTTCLGRPGSDSHEQLDADTWASWGVDYLKEDSCGGTTHGTVWEQYAKMRDALNKTGRPIYYSITEGVPFEDGALRGKMHCYGNNVFTVKPWVAEGHDPTALANSYLVEYCNNLDFFGFTGGIPRPGGTLSQLDSQALLTYDNLTKIGSYNDPDMLTICNGGQSDAEYRAQLSVRNLSASCADIILNKEIIAINQDANVVRAPLVWQWPDAHWPPANATVPPSQQHLATDAADSDAAKGPSAPPMLAQAVLGPCETAARWHWKNSSAHHMLATTTSSSGDLCLTYGGYTEANVGLAGCVGWDSALVGGQTWEFAAGSEGGMIIHQSAADGGAGKCLAATLQPDPKTCAIPTKPASAGEAAAPVECCDCGNEADCSYHSHCPTAQEFVLQEDNGAGGAGGIGMQLQSALNSSVCLTVAPLPHADINITLQIWAKPLASPAGSVAAVALNRGDYPADVTFGYTQLGLHAAQSYEVRDLWAHTSNGTHQGSFVARVMPHDVVMVIFTPHSSD